MTMRASFIIRFLIIALILILLIGLIVRLSTPSPEEQGAATQQDQLMSVEDDSGSQETEPYEAGEASEEIDVEESEPSALIVEPLPVFDDEKEVDVIQDSSLSEREVVLPAPLSIVPRKDEPSAMPPLETTPTVTETLINYGADFMGLPGVSLRDETKEDPRSSYTHQFMYGDIEDDDDTGSSRDLKGFDFKNTAIDRGMSYGNGLMNSYGEAALSSLMDGGRVRLNFHFDRDGYFNGEGDVLFPFYDSAYTTFFTQFGARSMHDLSDTRWIGNMGVGHRWFPLAEGDFQSEEYTTGRLMLGYNLFYDYDFTRYHQRGGVGIEAQYHMLRLSSNYYFPLSGWKGSKDFDAEFINERAAKGWDVRAKGYLPFYPNIALTGSFTKWYGDHVGMFGPSTLEKNPKVWSYGVEYTPIPLVHGYFNQKSTERGESDSEFGMRFTYHLQMPWKDQISHAAVGDLRTVDGSRHEFVDRENRIILEYKAKDGAYNILLRTLDATRNIFEFQLTDGFGKAVSGETVNVSAESGVMVLNPSTGLAQSQFSSDSEGRISIQLSPLTAGMASVTLTAGRTSRTFTMNLVPLVNLTLTAASGDHYIGEEVSLVATFKDGSRPLSGVVMNWTLEPTPGATLTPAASPSSTDGSGQATAMVKSTIAQTLTVKVTATVDGIEYAAEARVEIKVNSHGLSLSVGSAYVGDDVPIVANFKDGNGQDVSGVLLIWTLVPDPTPGAVLTPAASPSVTDGSGQATAMVKSAIAQTLTVKVTATVNGIDYETTVDVPFKAPILTLTPDSGQHLINSTVALTFTMAGPAAVDNQAVTWSTSDGALSSMTSATDSGGLATVNLTGPPNIQGPVTVRATLDNGQYVEAKVSFGTLRGIITVKPQAGSSDIVPSGGSTVLEARIIDPQFDDGTGEVDYTGSLGGLRLNWGKSGEYVFSQTGASASPPSGVSPTNALVAPLFSSSVTPTDANGLATVTFAPGISYGTAGGVQIKAEMAAPHSVGGTVNLAVGFDPNWRDNSSPDGWSTACQAAGGTCNSNQSGYQTTTKLPTFEQLLGISINYSRPASLAVTNAQFWTGAASGMGPSSGVVRLDTSVASWENNGLTSTRILILR